MLTIRIRSAKTAQRIRELADKSGAASPDSWVTQVLEDWILMHRSNRPYVSRPEDYDARQVDDTLMYDVD